MKSKAPHKKSSKNRWGAAIGSLLVFLAGAALFVAVSMERDPYLAKVTDFNMASETHRKIFAECLDLHKQLDELKLPHSFNKLEIELIDPLPAKDQISSALASCLSRNANSPYAIQGEVFSSEYEGKDGDIIVLQLNFIDKTGNKIMELNHHWTTSDFKPSESSSSPAPQEQAQPSATQAPTPPSPSQKKSENSFQEINEEGNTDLGQKL